MIILAKTNNPKATIKNMILSFLENGHIEVNGKQSDELFIFINSVSMIIDIVQFMELPKELYKVVCANTAENKDKLKIIDAEIDLNFLKNKKINFITSTAFLGCDFYSKNGIKIIVTDVHKKFSMLDVNTQILQINGRIRDKENPFNDLLIHVSNFKYQDEETDNLINEKFAMSKKIEREFSNDIIDVQKYNISRIRDFYLKYDPANNIMKFDDVKYKAELLKNNVYSIHYKEPDELLKEYKSQNVSSGNVFYIIRENESIKNAIKERTLKEYYELYESIKDQYFNLSKSVLESEIRKRDIDIPEEVNVLGITKIRALKYSKPQIKTEMIFESNEFKIAVLACIRDQINTKRGYTSDEIKTLLNSIYERLNVKKKATAKELERYVKIKTKRLGSKLVYLIEL